MADPPVALTTRDVYRYVEGATIAILLHEVGHALIRTYALPIVGLEENAADEFATLFLFNQARRSPEAIDFAASFYDYFMTHGAIRQKDKTGRLRQNVYWDEHDIAERRAFNILCNMYGAFSSLLANPTPIQMAQRRAYEKGLQNLGTSKGRIQRCAADAGRNFRSWTQLLQPLLRSDADASARLKRVLSGDSAKLEHEAGFSVTYAGGRVAAAEQEALRPLELSDIYQNDRLRYFLLVRVAALLNAWLLPPKTANGPFSINIVSRSCSRQNAFFRPADLSITLCHELFDAIVDSYVRFYTGQTPQQWWRDQSAAQPRPLRRALSGTWKARDGSTLELQPGGQYKISGSEAAPIRRTGFWDAENNRIWFVETGREGTSCYNPACLASDKAPSLARGEFRSLRSGAVPPGEVRGRLQLPTCRVEEVTWRKRQTDDERRRQILAGKPAEFGMLGPCAGKEPKSLVATIAVDGTLFESPWRGPAGVPLPKPSIVITPDDLAPPARDKRKEP
ncbi:MAG: hypothetical protein KDJ47_13905 [Hyphomicrobiaceae bacterium]|nr:hypothetical protein [Hyphomicrobiaceae bacterium]